MSGGKSFTNYIIVTCYTTYSPTSLQTRVAYGHVAWRTVFAQVVATILVYCCTSFIWFSASSVTTVGPEYYCPGVDAFVYNDSYLYHRALTSFKSSQYLIRKQFCLLALETLLL
jgi:hypothetical protein